MYIYIYTATGPQGLSAPLLPPWLYTALRYPCKKRHIFFIRFYCQKVRHSGICGRVWLRKSCQNRPRTCPLPSVRSFSGTSDLIDPPMNISEFVCQDCIFRFQFALPSTCARDRILYLHRHTPWRHSGLLLVVFCTQLDVQF